MSASSANEIDIKYEPLLEQLPSECLGASNDKTTLAEPAVVNHEAPHTMTELEPFSEVNFKEELMEIVLNEDALLPIEEVFYDTHNLKPEEPCPILPPDDGDPLTDANSHATKSELDGLDYPECEPMAFVSLNIFECSRCRKTFANDQRLQLHLLECRAKDNTESRELPSSSTSSVTRQVNRRKQLLQPGGGSRASVNEEDAGDQICNCVIETVKSTPFSSLSVNEKNDILKAGRPTPELATLKTKTKTCVRQFYARHYQSFPWLTGCKGTNKLYCWPCILFSTEIGPWQKWGYDDLKNLARSVARHESSSTHLQALIDFQIFGNSRIDLRISKASQLAVLRHNESVQKKRLIVERLIRVVCLLGINELDVGEHDWTDDSDNRGNFADSVQMLSEYDDQLSRHLSEDTTFSGLSSSVQNGLILSIGCVMLDHIKAEIKEASFIAISLYEATDVRNLPQLSSVLRYVNKSGEVVERFVEFSDIGSSRTATAVAKYVVSLLETFECCTKLVAQTYDGASVKSGQLSDLQARVKEFSPEALLVHSDALGLNLVLSQAFQNSDILKCKIFFKTVRGLGDFLSNSNKQTEALGREVKKRFPPVCPTRWSYEGRLVETIVENRKELISMFEGIVNDPDSWDIETYLMAGGYLDFLESFDANFLLAIFSELFALTALLFQVVQSKCDDIKFCVKHVTKLKIGLSAKRTEFNRFWAKVLEMSPNPPFARKKRLNNEEIAGSYTRLFFEILDIVEQQISARFDDLARLSFFNLMDCSKSLDCAKNFPVIAFESLKENYGNFFDFPRLKSELVAFYFSKQMENLDVKMSLKLIIDNDLEKAFSQLVKLCGLIMTIPVSSMPVKNSAMKRIASYLRNATGKARLPQYHLMAIEKQILTSLLKAENRAQFYERVINDFANTSQRMELTFK